jgi:hypothetical protein
MFLSLPALTQPVFFEVLSIIPFSQKGQCPLQGFRILG